MLDDRWIARARDAVDPMARRLGLNESLARYGERRWRGPDDSRLPVLHLEDVSGIPFVSLVPGVEEYQHRARVRAGDGDLLAAVTPPSGGFEDYCRSHLALGSPEFVLAEPVDGHSFAVAQACSAGAAFDRITARAREANGLVIHPYMSIDEVWSLAEQVGAAAGVPVHVIGPPPPVLWIANDKSLLSEVVTSVLSEEWIVETERASDPAEMAEHLVKLARHHGSAGLKRTRCASAMGNAVYELSAISRMAPGEILDEVRSFLERTEWALNEEVLIVAWEQTDQSPSTQLWIPPAHHGPPQVAGVYEQILEGEERVFLGSRPSLLPEAVNRELTEASLKVGAALQHLGYVGRCSFDFILTDDDAGGVRAKFVECNGRWGGTSTPMRLVDRVVSGPRPPYRAQDYMHRDLVGIGFPELRQRLGDALYDPSNGTGQYLLYNVGPLARNGKFDVVALGGTPAEVERAIHEDLPRRLGLA